jgi:hypothetical protein
LDLSGKRCIIEFNFYGEGLEESFALPSNDYGLAEN